jgi:dipeptidyl aminopeptidase/acylaminoacyl peptidase
MVAYADDASGQFNLMVGPTAGGSPRRLTTFSDNTVRHVAWYPDGRSLVFLADAAGNESTQLYRVDVGGGEVAALTDMPGVQYAAALGDPFSPDGRLLCYAGNDRVARDQDVLVRDLASGTVHRTYAGGGQVWAGHWSPDGSRLSVAEWVDGMSHHIVYVAPVDGGPAVRLTPQSAAPATYWLGPWLPDGSGFLVCSNSGREFAGLAVMDAATGALRWLDSPDWDVEEVTMSADGHVMAWLVNVDGASELRARRWPTGENLDVPPLPAGEAGRLRLSRDGTLAVLQLSTPTRPRNLLAVDLAAGELRWLTGAVPNAADPNRMVEPELVRYQSGDGTPIPGYLYRPVAASGPLPVVMSLHGGPQFAERPTYVGIYQYLLANGIAVFAPNPRGSTGYGKSYQTRLHRDWGGVDLDDWAAAVAWLRSQPWVDARRIGLFGGSYGGFGVLSCLSRLPDVDWAAAVVFFGISNLVTVANAAPPTWRSMVATQIGDPDADAAFLLSRSPITYADQIRAPLMVIQGANDIRVPRQESDQIVQRLRERGIEVRYDVYPDEGHGFAKTENQTRSMSDAAEFLIAHLIAPTKLGVTGEEVFTPFA